MTTPQVTAATPTAQRQPPATAKTEVVIDASALATSPAAAKTQIIAIYGKGGIGKSFTLANLSHMMAEQGKRVLLIGCDPKSDTTSLLFGGKACPTIIETSTKKKLAGEEVKIGDVCFKRGGVFAMELGGPEVYTLKELVQWTARTLGLKRAVIGLPNGVSRLQAGIMDFVPGKPFSTDNYRSLQVDNVTRDNALPRLGIRPASIDAIVPDYLVESSRQRRLRKARAEHEA